MMQLDCIQSIIMKKKTKMEFQNKNKKKFIFDSIDIQLSTTIESNTCNRNKQIVLYTHNKIDKQNKNLAVAKYIIICISLNDVNLTKPNLFYQQNRFNDYFHHPQHNSNNCRQNFFQSINIYDII